MAARDSADVPTPVPGRPVTPGAAGNGAGAGTGRVLGSFLDPAKLNPAGLAARGADAETVAPEDLAESISATIPARFSDEPNVPLTAVDGEPVDEPSDDGDPGETGTVDAEGGSVLDDFDDDFDVAENLSDEGATLLSDPPPGDEGPASSFHETLPAPEAPGGTPTGNAPTGNAPTGNVGSHRSDATLIGGDTADGFSEPARGPVGNMADDDSLAGASSQSAADAGDAADVPTGQMGGDAADVPTGQMGGDAADVPTGQMGGDAADAPTGQMRGGAATLAGGETADGTGPGVSLADESDFETGDSNEGDSASGAGRTAGAGRTVGAGRDGTEGGGSSQGGGSRGGGTAAGASGRTVGNAGWSAAGRSAGASAGASLTGGASHISESVPTRRIAANAGSAELHSTDYAVLAALGEGGMGVVSRAEQRSLGRDVALKQVKGRVSARQKARLATEAVVTGELEHPNIVPVYDLGRDVDGNLFYAMKVIGGRGWHKVLKLALGEEGALSEEEHLDVWLKVADAVAFAHSRGVVNYDLKPENVQLDGFGQVLVLDWGLAHVTERFASPGRVADNQRGGGSPAYMAPEQGHNQLASMRLIDEPDVPVTAAVDVYLLGAMLWEVATGRRPHTGDDEVAEQIARRAGRPQAVRLDKTLACCVAARENVLTPTDRDDELIAVALKAMATDPADRYESVEALQAAVREYRAHGQSRRLTARGSELVATGELARGAAAFDDAVALWPENDEAKTLATDTQRRLDRRKTATRSLALSLALVTLIGFGAVSYTGYQQHLARKEAEAARNDLIAAQDVIVQEKNAALAAAEAEKKATTAAVRAREDEAKAKEQALAAAVAARKSAEAEKAAKELAVMEQERAQDAAEAARVAAEAERQAKIAAIDARRVSEHRSYVSLVRAADDRRRDDLGGARSALETLDRTALGGGPVSADALAGGASVAAAPPEPEGFEVRYLRAELARSEDSVAAALAGGADGDEAAGPAPDFTGVAALPTPDGRPSRFAVAGADGVIRLEPATPGGAPILLRDPQLRRFRSLATGAGPNGPLLAAVGDGRRGDPISVAVWDLNDVAEQTDAEQTDAEQTVAGPAGGESAANEPGEPIEPTRRLGALRPGSALIGVRVGRGPDGPLVLAWGEEAAGGEGLEQNRPHGALFAWSPTAGAAEPALRIGLSGDERAADADLSADGARLAAVVGAGNGSVRLWNLSKNSPDDALVAENAGAFRGHTTFRSGSAAGALTDGATCVRFAPDGPWGPGRVVSGGAEGRVLIWNAADVRPETGAPPRDLRGRPGAPPRPPRSVETLAVWAHHDGARGLPVRALSVLKAPDPTAAEGGVALFVASAGDDARVRLWRTDGAGDGIGAGAGGLSGDAVRPARDALAAAAAGQAPVGTFIPLVWDESNATDPAGKLARQSPATLDLAQPPNALELAAVPGGYELLAVGPAGEADRLTDTTLAPVAVAAGDAGAAGSRNGRALTGGDGELLDLKRPITALRTAPGRPGAVAAANAGGAIRLVTEDGHVGRYEEGTLQSSRDTYAALSPAGLGLGGIGAGSGRRLAATTSAGAVLLWDVPRRGLVRRYTPARELVTASRRAPLPAVAAAVAEVDAVLAAQMSDDLGETIRAGSVVLAYAAGDRTVAVLRWPQDGPPVPIRRIRLDVAPTALGFTGDVSALVIGSEDGRLWAANPFLVAPSERAPNEQAPADGAEPTGRNPVGPARLLGDTGERRVPPLVVKPLPGTAALVGNRRLFRVDLAGVDLLAAPDEAKDEAKNGGESSDADALAITQRYAVENPIVTQTAVWPAGAFGAAAGFAVVEQTDKDARDLVIFRADQSRPLARLPLGSRAFAVAAAPDSLRPRLAVTVGSGTNSVVRVLEIEANGAPRSIASLPTAAAGGAVSAAAFSGDGARLLLSTPAGVAIWDPTKNAPEDGRLGGGAGETTLAFDPAGEFLLAGDAAGTFQLLRAEPGRAGDDGSGNERPGSERTGNAADGGGGLPALLKRSVPAVGTDEDGNPPAENAVARPAITAVAIGGDPTDPPERVRTLLVAAGRRAWLYDYDPAGDAIAQNADAAALSPPRGLGGDFAAHEAPITAAAFVPGPENQAWALTADADGAVRLWDVNEPGRALAEAFAEFGGVGAGVHDLAVPAAGMLTRFAEDGTALSDPGPTDRRLVVAAATDSGPFVWVLAPPGAGANNAAPNGEEAEGDGADGAAKNGGNAGAWTSVRVALRGRGGAARGVAFAPDRPDRLISAGADGAAQIWDWNGSAAGWDPTPGPEIADAGWVVSESLLALDRLSSRNGTARNVGGHEGGLTAVAVAPDGAAVLTGGEDGRVLRWTAPPPADPRIADGR